MSDEEIIAALRFEKGRLTPVDVGSSDRLTGRGLSDRSILFCFKRAFPEIPLDLLVDSGLWTRVGRGHLSDEGFNQLLCSWL
jgi:hypothetical protein